jgi:hypothetical protein
MIFITIKESFGFMGTSFILTTNHLIEPIFKIQVDSLIDNALDKCHLCTNFKFIYTYKKTPALTGQGL